MYFSTFVLLTLTFLSKQIFEAYFFFSKKKSGNLKVNLEKKYPLNWN